MSDVDAIVVGAGPNGLVAANRLLDAGWSVLLIEEQPTLGGAVRSDEEVHPAFTHDTFSAFYPLAACSPALRGLDLHEHGLRWRHAPAVLGHPLPDGRWALLHRDRTITARLMEEQSPGDGERWLALCALWDRIGDSLVAALLSPFPPVRAGLAALVDLRGAGGLEIVKLALSPVTGLADARFDGELPRLVLAGNAAHADIPLDGAGSGLMGLLMTMLGQTVGFPVPEGGAGRLTEALARRFEAGGGEVLTAARVSRIDVQDGRVSGVRTADGERFGVRRAVIADVLASQLYGELVDPAELGAKTLRRARGFQLDPGTVKVDWALDGPVPWASPPPAAPGAVHIADSREQMLSSVRQVAAGYVPARPFLLAGQMTTADPVRSPPGTEAMWAYTRVPRRIAGDSADRPQIASWDRAALRRFADRMQERLESLAPGFTSRVVARRVLGPRELQARDANLVGGAVNGGTSQLHQQLVLRPFPGLGRPETPIAGLYLGSASAHPGGGVHGAPGLNAARAALAHARVGRLLGPLRRARAHARSEPSADLSRAPAGLRDGR